MLEVTTSPTPPSQPSGRLWAASARIRSEPFSSSSQAALGLHFWVSKIWILLSVFKIQDQIQKDYQQLQLA